MMRSLMVVFVGFVVVLHAAAQAAYAEMALTRSEVILRGTGPGGTMGSTGSLLREATFSFGIYPYHYVWQVGPVGVDDIGATFELTPGNTGDYLQAHWQQMTGYLTDGTGLEGPELGDYVTYGLGGVTGGAFETVFEKQFFYDNSIYTDPMNPRVTTDVFFTPGGAPDLQGFSITRMTMRVDSVEFVDSAGATWLKGGFTLSIFGEPVPEPSCCMVLLLLCTIVPGRLRRG